MNIFKLVMRSYFDVYNALKSAYKTFPDWLWVALAGFFDMVSELINVITTDIFSPFTRESAYSFADHCDYAPVESDGSTVTLTITLQSAMAKTLLSGYQVGGISAINGQYVIYELTANASSGGTNTITASAKQQKTETSINIGQITSSDEFFELPVDGYTGIIKTTISIVINALSWTRVDNFDNSINTDKHFVLIYQSNGKARVQFGNGTTGEMPPLNEFVFATFATTLGTQGRLDAGLITINTGKDADIKTITNALAASGGNSAESVNSIVRNSRANVRLRNAIFFKDDLEIASLAASSSVIKSYATPGVGTAILQIVPAGGGLPSAGLKTTVKTYVEALTLFGEVPINVVDPSYIATVITATVTVRTGFTAATVRSLVDFGLTLVSSAIDIEIIEYYADNGIDLTRTDKINAIWGFTFASAENEALEYIINKWVDMLGDRVYREWGQPLEVGNLWQMGDSLYDYGVDVFNLTAPTVNTTTTASEIINSTSITVT